MINQSQIDILTLAHLSEVRYQGLVCCRSSKQSTGRITWIFAWHLWGFCLLATLVYSRVLKGHFYLCGSFKSVFFQPSMTGVSSTVDSGNCFMVMWLIDDSVTVPVCAGIWRLRRRVHVCDWVSHRCSPRSWGTKRASLSRPAQCVCTWHTLACCVCALRCSPLNI